MTPLQAQQLVYPTILSSEVVVGPGNNTPCTQHRTLDQAWRLIGRRPLSPGVGYHCDRGLLEGWYRFRWENLCRILCN